MSTMGERIKQKRKEYDLTMEELGSLLGVNKTAVNKWEKGIVKNIKQSTIKRMSEIFHCSPAWLMGFDSEEEKTPLPITKENYSEFSFAVVENQDVYLMSNDEEKEFYDLYLKWKDLSPNQQSLIKDLLSNMKK